MAGEVNPLVQDIGLALLAAGGLSVVGERLRLPQVAAFLAAGVLIGPIGLKLVTNADNIETIASLGLTLLLFLIGLEIDFRGLLASGRALLIGGVLQVPLTVLGAFGLLSAAAGLGLPVPEGSDRVYLSLACAFSSTLLVVKLLQERLRMDTTAGRLAVGILIFQDLWAIVILALQPRLDNPSVGPVVSTFVGIAIVALVAAGMARLVLPSAFRLIAKQPPLLVTASLAWCFGLGLFGVHLGEALHWIGVHAPLSVSLELGALIAGASIASFPFAHDVVAKIGNLRDFFITLFFVALGMGIPVPESSGTVILALTLAFVAVVARPLIFLPLFRAGGLSRRHGLEATVFLAQISEFALVIAYLGQSLGHLSQDTVTVITLGFVFTALATPALFTQVETLTRASCAGWDRLRPLQRGPEGEAPAAEPHDLVILGFHRVASSLLCDIGVRYPDLLSRTLIIDFNLTLHDAIRATGAHVKYGDLASPSTLAHLGLEHAHVLLATVGDELLKGTTNRKLVAQLRAIAPKAEIIAIAVHISEIPKLYEAGATYVYLMRTETSLGLLPALDAALNGDLAEWVATRRMLTGPMTDRREVLD